MGPPSYMRSVVDRNVVMRRMTVLQYVLRSCLRLAKRKIQHSVLTDSLQALSALICRCSSPIPEL